jgi:exonuclease SbcD
MDIDDTKINILVAHQFVTGSSRSDSEDYIVGGLDNVDSYVFKPFDYVALGHLHNPQDCGSDNIRYCGSPLKYSFSEAKSEKSVTVIEFEGKGAFSKKIIPLKPKRDLVEIKGEYKDLTAKSFYENTSYRDDYVHITLTDENFIPDVVSKLRVIYRNLMKVDYDNETTRKNTVINTDSDVKRKTPHELFSDFYEMQNAQPMNKEQSDFMKELIKKIEEKTIQ